MDLELLQSISLAVSQARTVDSVLKMIVDGLVDRAGLALARIWLMGPGDICATCPMAENAPRGFVVYTSPRVLAARRSMGQNGKESRVGSDGFPSASERWVKSVLPVGHS